MSQAAALDLQTEIFRRGSKTYFRSSHFFPAKARADVTILYGFVRVADDLVDNIPPKVSEFASFCAGFRGAWTGTPSGNQVIDDFVELAHRKGFELSWIEDFLVAMESDLHKKTYDNLDEILGYVWGSAEVIGLFLCKIFDLPPEARLSATRLGRSMQFINFLRDLDEDYQLGRRYFPLQGTGLAELSLQAAQAHPQEFEAFVRAQAQIYTTWQNEGASGYGWLPRRFLIAVKTASDLYNWTAKTIQRDPWVVWKRKVKPTKLRILLTALGNFFYFPPRTFAKEPLL